MSWVSEKEEWLVDWSYARCLGEVSFLAAGADFSAAASSRDSPDIFFSDAIEAGGRCLVCRVSGPVVDVFDVSPAAEALVSWRIHLPSLVVPDIGIASICSANGTLLSLLFLTKASVIHRAEVLLNLQSLAVRADGSTKCNVSSPPSAFCALDRDLAAVACFNGSLLAVRLGGAVGGPEPAGGLVEYEFSDSSMVRRMISGLLQPAAPHVLALATVVPRVSCASRSGLWMLAFSADGRLQLWEALERRAQLVASTAISSQSSQGHGVSLVGTSSTYMRVSPSKTRACLVLRSTVHVIDLVAVGGGAEGLAVREVEPPFPSAAPSLVALSHSSLWSFWSGPGREQLFQLDLEARDGAVWQARALDACLLSSEDAARPGLRSVVTEGCEGRGLAHRPVFTLYHQQDVWRAEEEGFEALQLAELLEASGAPAAAGATPGWPDAGGSGLEDLALRWWLGRVFLPGRYSLFVLALALEEAGGRPPHSVAEEPMRTAVEEHLRRYAAGHVSRRDVGADSHLHVATALASAASEFLHICDAVWRRSHQVCGISVSSAWAAHSWHPAGTQLTGLPEGEAACPPACPLMLCAGGISCVRAVHSWPERWWATLHLSRDLSNHERLEIDDVLGLTALGEWKLCTTAWFLSQCAGSSACQAALDAPQLGARPSAALRHCALDVPRHLAAHLARCAASVQGPGLAVVLETLRQALAAACCPESCRVGVLGRHLDALRGVWSDPSGSGSALFSGRDRVSLSDLLRGSIAVCEWEYASSAMRDLLLLCTYAGRDQAASLDVVWPLQGSTGWDCLAELLEQQLPASASLHYAMKLQLRPGDATTGLAKATLPARGCDFWASAYRVDANGRQLGLRLPMASFKSLQYAVQLAKLEGWEALRWWTRHETADKLTAYFAGCEWLAKGRLEAAREAFTHAEKAAAVLVECLHSCGLRGELPPSAPTAAYCEHVAALFAARRQPRYRYPFLKRAAELAEAAGPAHVGPSAQQAQWSAAFEQAVDLEDWDEAYEVLMHIDSFENHLRLLAQKLRSSGRIELMLKLPDKHRTFFINSLHEHASLSAPVAGSDCLSCYQHLYALYFTAQEYLKAATVAHALFSALSNSLRHFVPDADALVRNLDSFPFIQTGASISRSEDVPKQSVSLPGHAPPGRLEEPLTPPKASDHLWPLLEQQRNALLMLTAALALTPEQTLLVPQPHAAAVPEPIGSAGVGGEVSPAQLAGFGSWFAEAEGACREALLTLEDADRLLAVVEAQMVLSDRSDAHAPADVAPRVAALGLLALALQITIACGLDPWQFALQPFLCLCLESEQNLDKVTALVDAARGPSQAHMFVRSDGCQPLGSGGSASRAFWQMLEAGLEAVCRTSDEEGKALDASGVRLYSLVADQILESQPLRRLPNFLRNKLRAGSSWVCLLRLYMKHRCLEDAASLLGEQLRAGELRARSAERSHRSPLHDFPVSLAVQLQQYARNVTAKEKTGAGVTAASHLADALDAILAQLQRLVEDLEQASRR